MIRATRRHSFGTSHKSKPITLVLAEAAPVQLMPAAMNDLYDRLLLLDTQPKLKKNWTLRAALGIGFLVLAGNAVACEHGREVFVEHLRTHVPSALLYGGVVLIRRAEKHVPSANSIEKELAKETIKAVVETALFAMSVAAVKTVLDYCSK